MRMIFFLFLIPALALAGGTNSANWQALIDTYAGSNVSPNAAWISYGDDGNPYVGYWATNAIGKAQPTIDQLKSVTDASAKITAAGYSATNQATAQVRYFDQAMLDAINKRLPATNQITQAEVVTGTAGKIRANAVGP